MKRTSLTIGFVCLASVVLAQDPVKVDPKHYRVEFENAHVRVLHIQYGPHEKSVMHHHPAGVAVFLSDQDAKFTMPDGKTIDRHGKAGQALWMAAETHLPENVADKPLDVILVELKGGGAGAKRHQ